jgi:hypothetical protein
MYKSLDIQERMEVVGSDGKHVGTVDHKEGDERIILTKDDPKAGGRHHLISIDWVDYVDRKVHLNKPSQRAMSEWQVAAWSPVQSENGSPAAAARSGFAIADRRKRNRLATTGGTSCKSKGTTRVTSSSSQMAPGGAFGLATWLRRCNGCRPPISTCWR